MPSYDHAKRRQARRSGREKGCWLYVPAEQLQAAGFAPGDPAPFYRTWASTRGGLRARLYRVP